MTVPEESEEVKKLLEAKAKIEKRIKELEEELGYLRPALSLIDAKIAEESFKRAEVLIAPPEAPVAPAPVYKQTVPIRSKTGMLLATMNVGDNVVKIVPEESISFNVNTPPFKAFFIDRVLQGMVVRDEEEVKMGRMAPDKAFSYKVNQEGDILKEILISNFNDPRRLREIQTSLRWTLERMYEKMVT